MSPRDTVRRVLERMVGVLSAVIILMAVISAASVLLIQREVAGFSSRVAPVIDLASEARIAGTDAQTNYRAYLLTEDQDFLDLYVGARERFEVIIETLEDATEWMGETATEEYHEAAHRWFVLAEEQIDNAAHGRAVTLRESSAQSAVVVGAHQQLMANALSMRSEQRANYSRLMTGAVVTMAITSLIALALTRHQGRLATRRLARPLQSLEGVVTRHREGAVEARANETEGASEVIAVARAFNSLADTGQELQRQREQLLELYRVTGRVAGQLASRGRRRWDQASRTLGAGMGVDRVVVYEVEGLSHQALGAYRADGHPPAPILDSVVVDRISEVVKDNPTIIAADPQQIRERLPESVASAAEQAGVQAWVLQPLVVSGEALGAVSVAMDRPREWHAEEIQAIDRVATYVSHTLVERRYVASLEDLDQQKTTFMATTSHELRTPLTSIAGYLEMLEDGDFGELTPEQTRAITVIDRNVTRLRALIEDLLLLNRLDSGQARMRPQPVDLTEVITSVLCSLAPVAATAQVELIEETPDEPVVVHGDRDQLERAVMNIAANGIKFSRAGDRVTLRLTRAGDTVLIECEDTGIGVPAADQSKLFSRFFRAHNAQNLQVPGTGLGLSIVQSIIEAHGGHAALESQEGVGTTIRLTLPANGPTDQPSGS
ncbi:MAG: ATP-binding protein [Actinomycetia bacterium]|nr:ATP-binding protein [Actinomycetes bacterium]